MQFSAEQRLTLGRFTRALNEVVPTLQRLHGRGAGGVMTEEEVQSLQAELTELRDAAEAALAYFGGSLSTEERAAEKERVWRRRSVIEWCRDLRAPSPSEEERDEKRHRSELDDAEQIASRLLEAIARPDVAEADRLVHLDQAQPLGGAAAVLGMTQQWLWALQF